MARELARRAGVRLDRPPAGVEVGEQRMERGNSNASSSGRVKNAASTGRCARAKIEVEPLQRQPDTSYVQAVIGYIPADPPRVTVAPDGVLAAIHELRRITLVALPVGEPVAVIELDRDALSTDVGWIAGPSRLIVLTTFASHGLVRIIDPVAPGTIAQRRIDPGLRLRACANGHALAASPAEAVILSADADVLTTRPVRARRPPAIAGAMGARFVVVVDATLVEWDPATATSRRTWRLPPGETITGIGGSERQVWRTTREAPNRIDVLTVVALGQPRVHELPEPIVQVAAHAHADVLACLGASGRVHVVDLAAPREVRVVDTAPVMHPEAIGLVVDAKIRVVACERGRPTTVVPITRRAPGASPTWRDELLAWTRSGIVERVPVIAPIDALARRLALPDELTPAVTLCYGAHLCGAPGVPPDEINEILGGGWGDEARGNGRLAATGVLVFDATWVALARAHAEHLDAV